MTEIKLRDFLNGYINGQFGKIEIKNYIEKITDNFQEDKVRLLKEDIEDFHNELLIDDSDLYPPDNYNGDMPRSIVYFQNEEKRKQLKSLKLLSAKSILPVIQRKLKTLDKEEEAETLDKKNYLLSETIVEEEDYLIPETKCLEKIIYVVETGILEFLREKNSSNSNLKMAKILAPILTEKVSTIQSIINAVLNDNISKNNPYKNFSSDGESSKINTVREKLIEFGIKPNGNNFDQNLKK